MIDNLLKATGDRNWSLVSQILYEHWVTQSVECFDVKDKDPWETLFDEKKISELHSVVSIVYFFLPDDTLLYPFAAALCQDKDCRDKEGNPSVQRLAEVTGFNVADAIIGRGQTCGRMFRFGEPTYSCRYFWSHWKIFS